MDSDDDFELFTHPDNKTPSPPIAKMKRLKKIRGGLLKHSVETDEVLMVDAFSRDEDFVTRAGDETDLDGEVESEKMDECDIEIGIETEKDSVDVEKELSAKRALDFEDGDADGGGGDEEDEGEAGLEIRGKGLDANEGNEEGTGKRKKRKNRSRTEADGDGGELDSGKIVSKRRSEKERSEYLNQLHYESQRLLRETRDAGFKPAPVVHKPISSVLEKIRKRKLELLKKTAKHNYINDEDDDEDDLKFLAGVLKPKLESVYLGGKMDDEQPEQVNVDNIRDGCEVECDFKDASVDIQEDTDEKPTSTLRSPVCDTQDLFCDSDTSDSMNRISGKIAENASASEENFVPSILAMNLRFDSAPFDDDDDNDDDDVYSDEEDNDKENVAPNHPMPRGGLVQAFLDDEAVEEDDSDNDQLRFQENEDEDVISEDADDLDEMIATDYEENQTDQEKRRELHMKMLEQQDAEGIDNLLHKYKCESKLSKPDVLNGEDIIGEDGSYDEAIEPEAPKNSLRLCVKKAKQMIVHMFTDNDDPYVSSEDEELETRVVNRVFRKSDEKKKIITPDQDESSREVFGMIKKLNIAAEMKKKTKISSFDIIPGKNKSFSKMSFLHRSSSNSLPSSRKHGSSVTRAFVFARDDSNSRSSIVVSEDSNMVQNEVQPTVRSTTKFSQSQSKSKPKDPVETVAGSSSLFEMLRHSAAQQHNRDGIVKSANSVFDSFKLPKRSKIEGKI